MAPYGRPVNAEEAVLPMRTVVIIVLGCLGVTGLFWTARGQWDDTQQAIQETHKSIDLLAKEQADFRQYIADLIVKKGAERDAQFAKVNGIISDLSGSVTDLNAKIAQLKSTQDSSHDDTVAAITAIRGQIDNIVKDVAVMKCKLPGNDCGARTP